jgi:antitoxin HicB
MRKTKRVYSYQIDLVPDEEGGYTVIVPAVPGCISYGETVEEATRNAREAIVLHLENLAAHEQPIPGSHDSVPVYSTLVQVTPSNVRWKATRIAPQRSDQSS